MEIPTIPVKPALAMKPQTLNTLAVSSAAQEAFSFKDLLAKYKEILPEIGEETLKVLIRPTIQWLDYGLKNYKGGMLSFISSFIVKANEAAQKEIEKINPKD